MKRWGKDLSKKLVASDYKNNRVRDPTAKLNEKQARKLKTYVKDFLDRAVHKYEAQKKEQGEASGSVDNTATGLSSTAASNKGNDAEEQLSDMNMDDSPISRKRKHDDATEGDADTDLPDATPTTDGPEMKRLREDEVGAAATPSPPPPPPPPLQDEGAEELTEEQKALREQERALEQENEEAQRLEDEAQRTTNGEQKQNRKQEVLSH